MEVIFWVKLVRLLEASHKAPKRRRIFILGRIRPIFVLSHGESLTSLGPAPAVPPDATGATFLYEPGASTTSRLPSSVTRTMRAASGRCRPT